MSKILKMGATACAFILSEAAGHRSRENLHIGEEIELEAGGLLVLSPSPAGVTAEAAIVAGGTGNGTIAMADPAVNNRVKNGVYRVIFTAATAFKVEDPEGKEIGTGAVGSAFNKEVKFTITAGDTAHVAGDLFEVTIGVETPDDLLATPYDPASGDLPSAISLYNVATGADETETIAAIFRDAEVNGHLIAWPEAITATDRAAAVASLAKAGIIVRD